MVRGFRWAHGFAFGIPCRASTTPGLEYLLSGPGLLLLLFIVVDDYYLLYRLFLRGDSAVQLLDRVS